MTRADIFCYVELLAGLVAVAGAYVAGRELTRAGSSFLLSIVS
jgi:hypothetical protein